MVDIFVKVRGKVQEICADPGISLMSAIKDERLPILAICDGCLSCATCHVYIDPFWLCKLDSPAEDEEDMLDLAPDAQPNSRLACQIILTPALNGLSLEIAPSSLIQP